MGKSRSQNNKAIKLPTAAEAALSITSWQFSTPTRRECIFTLKSFRSLLAFEALDYAEWELFSASAGPHTNAVCRAHNKSLSLSRCRLLKRGLQLALLCSGFYRATRMVGNSARPEILFSVLLFSLSKHESSSFMTLNELLSHTKKLVKQTKPKRKHGMNKQEKKLSGFDNKFRWQE